MLVLVGSIVDSRITMHDKLSKKPRLSGILGELARRTRAAERHEAEAAGREELYNFARDKVVQEYTEANHDTYLETWVGLQDFLLDTASSSMRVEFHPYCISDHGVWLPQHASIHMGNIIRHDDSEFQLEVIFTLFDHASSRRHLTFPMHRTDGEWLQSAEEFDRYSSSSESPYLPAERSPHEVHGIPSVRLGRREYAVPTGPLIDTLRRQVIENAGFIHATVTAKPLGSKGDDLREIVLSATVSDIDHDTSLYKGHLPQYSDTGDPLIARLPARDDRVFDHAYAALPKRMPNRGTSHAAMAEIVEIATNCLPKKPHWRPQFDPTELRAMMYEFNGEACPGYGCGPCNTKADH